MDFYYHDGSQQVGPIDLEDLKTRSVSKATLIWHEGLQEWTPAEHIPELGSLFQTKAVPPPLPRKPLIEPTKLVQQPSFNASSTKQVKEYKEVQRWRIIWACIVTGIIIIGVVLWMINQNNRNRATVSDLQSQVNNTQQYISTQQTDENNKALAKQQQIAALTEKHKNYRNNWSNYITEGHSAYTYSALGGISNLSVIVTNNTEYQLDEVGVQVLYIKSNGETYQTETVSVYNVPPNSTRSAPAPNSNRGTLVKTSIVTIHSSKMHFCYQAGSWGGGNDDPYFCK